MPSLPMVKRYRLRLGNGQEWQIVGANRMMYAAQFLASIMQLEELKPYEGEGAPRLILKQWDAGDPADANPVCDFEDNMAAGLPTQGWKAYYPTLYRVLLHAETRDVIFEVKDPAASFEHFTPIRRRRAQARAEMTVLRQVVHTIYQQAQDLGGLPVHGALASWDGLGVLLLGNPDAGKSTCCRRLPASWQVLGDDEALVVCDRRGQYFGHPFPTWSNFLRREMAPHSLCRSWCVEQCVPIAAIFVLEQAESDQIIPIGQAQAALSVTNSATQVWQVLSESYRNRSIERKWPAREQLFDNACALIKSVPAFTLRVSLKGRFWEEIQKTLLRTPAAVNGGNAVSVG